MTVICVTRLQSLNARTGGGGKNDVTFLLFAESKELHS